MCAFGQQARNETKTGNDKTASPILSVRTTRILGFSGNFIFSGDIQAFYHALQKRHLVDYQ